MIYNESQLRAIRHKDGPMLVLAGPGSGKTATITARTIYLTKECHVAPSELLVITFTRAAAQEMRQRYLRETGESGTEITFGTFHAVFFMVLKIAYRFTRDNIISEDQRYRIMREILSRHRLEYRDESDIISEIFSEISRVKSDRIPIENFYSACCGEDIFRSIFREYKNRLQRSRLIDFDDMLDMTCELFLQRKDILSRWQEKYKYIMIDEFQDINPVQWDIMKMMAGPRSNIFVVGDDDQAIYRFRGAKPEIMLGFREDYPDAKMVNLSVNYRCPPAIVEAAGSLIAKNEARYKKETLADKKERGMVRYMQFEDQKRESEFIISEITKAKSMGEDLSKTAVLFRTNMQPGFLMGQLVAVNMPFIAKDKIQNIYEHWIARDIFAYLRIAQGSDERADFLCILNKPNRYISRGSLTDAHIDFMSWMDAYEEQPWVAERIEKLMYDTRQLGRLSPYAAINFIRKGIGYDEYLEDYANYRRINKEDLLAMADEILSSAKGFQTFGEWYGHIEKYNEEIKRRISEKNLKKEGVTLATLHSAKGLEFDRVFIIDACEGVMPYKKAVLTPDLEEERRLFYVGMTRAARELTICSVREMHTHAAEPSRFIREAGGV